MYVQKKNDLLIIKTFLHHIEKYVVRLEKKFQVLIIKTRCFNKQKPTKL